MTSCQVKEASSNGSLISGHVTTTNKFSVNAPTAKTYAVSETMSVVVTFPFDLVIDTTGGTPRLRMMIGATTRYGTYVPDANPRRLVFNYTIVSGDNDTNGIDVTALELNGSTIKFDRSGILTDADTSTVSTINFPSARVDTAAPTITDFKLTSFPGMYNAGEVIYFIYTFSEPVYVTGVPYFVLGINAGGPVNVNYVAGSGTNQLTMSFVVTAAMTDTDGYNSITSPLNLNGGSIKDTVGNDAFLDFASYIAAVTTFSANVLISGALPYVENFIVPANGTYVANQDLDFTVIFDRQVNVSGTPFLNVTIGSNTRQAQYISGSGTEQIIFRYTAIPGDVDANGIDVTGSIVQNAGNIVDKLATSVSYFDHTLNNVFAVPATSGIILNAVQPQPIAVARNVDTTIPTWGGPAVDNVWIPEFMLLKRMVHPLCLSQ
jgi:large repetitive protein